MYNREDLMGQIPNSRGITKLMAIHTFNHLSHSNYKHLQMSIYGYSNILLIHCKRKQVKLIYRNSYAYIYASVSLCTSMCIYIYIYTCICYKMLTISDIRKVLVLFLTINFVIFIHLVGGVCVRTCDFDKKGKIIQ